MPPVGFEPTISADKWPQTYAVDSATVELICFTKRWNSLSDNFAGGQQQHPQHLEKISSFNIIIRVTKQPDTYLQYLGHKSQK